MHEAVPDPSVVEYPTSDGKPLAESDLHFDRLTYAAHALKVRYADTPDVYVGANMLVYDEPGNPRRHLAPDVFVVFGVPNHRRDLFKIWEEKPPSFVLEVTSKSTRREDMRTKRQRYAAWGVQEYFLYDPRSEYLAPPFQGLTLREGVYESMPLTRFPNGQRGYLSRVLGIHLYLKGSELRLFDPTKGCDLRTYEEAQREIAELRARIRSLTGE
ncbi:MAG: Uma2 family endonuclease [Gammaproteobacteria bacterium]|nr:Uma2 family endonuclease [Gammaproteobacteria bacterium]